jgi:hypothetical protein
MFVFPRVKRSGESLRRGSLILGVGVAGLLGLGSAAFAQTQVNTGFSFYQEDTYEAGSGFTSSSPDYTGSGMINVNPSVGGGSDGFLNVVDGNGNWIVQNMPIDAQESSSSTSTPVDFGTPDDTQDSTFTGAVYFSASAQQAAPSGGTAQSYSLASDVIDPQGDGTDPNAATDDVDYAPNIGPGGANLIITTNPNWNGVPGGTSKVLIKNFATYNVQAALNQCGPSAEANGIYYLASNNSNFATALGVNFNNNPGQGIFASMGRSGTNPNFTYTPTGTYPYTGNASSYYVSNANANSANTVQTLSNPASANTSSLVSQLDIATARQAGAVNGPGPIYSETADRTQGQGVFPIQGLINFLNPYATANLQIKIGYESVNNFENPTIPVNANLTVTAQNAGKIDVASSPGWMYQQLSNGAMVTLAYGTYAYTAKATWSNTTGAIIGNVTYSQASQIVAHEVMVSGATVTGTGANAEYQFLLTSDLNQGNDLSLGDNPSFWTTIGSKNGSSLAYLNGASTSGQALLPGTINNGNGTSTGTYQIYYSYITNIEVASVPEPASASMLLLATAGFLRRRSRRIA